MLALPVVATSTSALIPWSVPEVIYSPEQYTIYYTVNNTCHSSVEVYNERVTVYGLNYTNCELLSIRNQQYNITLSNLSFYTVYCYKVVATNSMGKNESNIGTFKTKIPEGGMKKMISFYILGFTH